MSTTVLIKEGSFKKGSAMSSVPLTGSFITIKLSIVYYFTAKGVFIVYKNALLFVIINDLKTVLSPTFVIHLGILKYLHEENFPHNYNSYYG
jgi:hypothetical protein